MTQKIVYTIADQMLHNKCSRAWIKYCLEHGTLPAPDATTGKNGKVKLWYALHKIKLGKGRKNE